MAKNWNENLQDIEKFKEDRRNTAFQSLVLENIWSMSSSLGNIMASLRSISVSLKKIAGERDESADQRQLDFRDREMTQFEGKRYEKFR